MGNGQYTPLSSSDPNDTITPRLLKSASTYSTRQPKKKPSPHTDSIAALAAVRPGMLISGSKDKTICLNNLDVGESTTRWRGHDREVTKVVYRNTGGRHYVLSGSRDELIKLWQFNNSDTVNTYRGHRLPITGLVMYDQHHFASGSRDTSLRVWDVETGRAIAHAETNRNLVTHMAYHPQHQWIAQSSEDKSIKLWDSRTLEGIYTFPKRMNIQTHCDFTPDGNLIMAASSGYNGDGCIITLWDTRTHKIFKELKGHDETITSVAFLNQQVTWKKLLVSVSLDRTIKVWSIDDGVCVWSELVPPGNSLLACATFNDASVAVSGSDGLLAHLRLLGKAGRPFLHCTTYYTAGSSYEQ